MIIEPLILDDTNMNQLKAGMVVNTANGILLQVGK